MKKLSALFLATVCVALAARGNPDPKTEMDPKTQATAPKPAPEMERLRAVVPLGNWKCDGTSTPKNGPAHPVKASAPVRLDLNNFWQTARYEEKVSKENSMPVTVQEFFTYDPGNRNFVRVAVDSMGGWSTMTSPGPDGNRILFTGEANAMGKKMPMRMSFEKRNDKELKVDLESGAANGQFTKTIDLTCKR